MPKIVVGKIGDRLVGGDGIGNAATTEHKQATLTIGLQFAEEDRFSAELSLIERNTRLIDTGDGFRCGVANDQFLAVANRSVSGIGIILQNATARPGGAMPGILDQPSRGCLRDASYRCSWECRFAATVADGSRAFPKREPHQFWLPACSRKPPILTGAC